MSNENTSEWDKLWHDYSNSLENWRKIFDEVLKANTEMQEKFNAVITKASQESSVDTMKQFGESWQKAMSDAGLKSTQEFSQYWQKAMSNPDKGFEEFAEAWQKSLSTGAFDQMKTYGDMMKKFAETWNTMWPQK